MNKSEKVAILKAIASGEASLDILRRKQLKVIVNYNPPIKAMYYIDDVVVAADAYMKELSKQRDQKDFDVQIGLIVENSCSIRWL